LKILFAALKYDYGIQERGYSFEYYSFYDSLIGMGHEVEYFDFYSLYKLHGRLEMTKMLRRKVDELKPDLMFVFMFSDEFDREELRKITVETETITFNWFADDHWRFDNFSQHWAPCFDFVSTTDQKAFEKYKAIGYDNVLLTQWAANPRIWSCAVKEPRYGVTFIGQEHGNRKSVVTFLRKQGISVEVWGPRWKLTRIHEIAHNHYLMTDSMYERVASSTRVSQQEMIAILQQSQINLNLSASSQTSQNQIKGRNFEIPACGGFQISGYAGRLEEYFQIDHEIICYKTIDELVDKIRYYLQHEKERREIAEAGYRRILKEHTYVHRFAQLFKQMDIE
jgi:spore maturation protein CgeB